MQELYVTAVSQYTCGTFLKLSMEEKKILTVNQAVRSRINELLAKQGITQYRLEQNSGISHSQMDFIMKDRNKTVTFTTILQLAKGFDMTVLAFLDSPYFILEGLDIE